MPDKDYREQAITFEGGLVEYLEDSMLPPGTTAKLQNWQADPSGGLRARPGWNNTGRVGLPSILRGRGIGQVSQQVTNFAVPSLSVLGNGGTDSPGTFLGFFKTSTTPGSAFVVVLWLGTDIVGLTVPSGFTLAHASPNGLTRIYIRENLPGGSLGGTFSWTNGQDANIYPMEVLNVAATGVVDTIVNSSGTSTTPSSGTIPAGSTPNDVVIVAFRDNRNEQMDNPTNSFIERNDVELGGGGGSTARVGLYTRVLTAAGATSTSVTTATSDAWQSVSVTLKAKAIGVASTQRFYVVAHADEAGLEYEIYNIDSANLAAGAWTLMDTIATSAQGDPVAFTVGLKKLLYTNVRFAAPRQWDSGVGASPISGGPPGRCIAFHKSRVFIGGTILDPTLLSFSDVGSTSFTGGVSGSLYVGKDDGEPIEEIIPTELGLLIGKENSLWVLTGSGLGDFQLTQLSDGGAAPGRSMARTPYGTVVAGKEYVYLVQGGTVDNISEPIEQSYGMTGNWMSTSYRNGRCMILDQGSGVSWVYDFRRGVWQGTEFIQTAAEQPVILFDHGAHQLFAPRAAAINGLLGWRLIPDGTRAKDFDTLPETFEAWTPEMWLGGPETRVTPRYLFLKLRQRPGAVSDSDLVITPVYDGVADIELNIHPQPTAGAFWVTKGLGGKRGISSLQLKFKQELLGTEDAIFDIEQGVVGYNVEQIAWRS